MGSKGARQSKRWPKGFPDRNDYELVEACELTEGDGEVVVMWVQRGVGAKGIDVNDGEGEGEGKAEDSGEVGKDDEEGGQEGGKVKEGEGSREERQAAKEGNEIDDGTCYVVTLTGQDVSVLKDMADGMWGVVYEGSNGAGS